MLSLLVTVAAVALTVYPDLNPELSNQSASESQLASSDSAAPGSGGFFNSGYDLASHQTLSRVMLLVRENYVDPERVKPREMFLAALDYVEKSVPEVIVREELEKNRLTVQVGKQSRVFELGEMNQIWEVTMALRDIFRFMQNTVSEEDERKGIEYAAINGMLSTLDPHSVLLRPESFDEVKLSTKGEFGGLGIVISIRDGSLTIMSPISGTPASRAGLKARDKIVKIGAESTVNMGLEEAVSRLRGKPGTPVDIWVQRKKWSEPRKFQLRRAIIKIESVTSKLLADGVGYVKIKNFQGNTYDDLNMHLEKLKVENSDELKGLVLDLRNNPGGLLDQAKLISDRFIDHGALVITVGEGNRKREVIPAHFAGTEMDYPIVVLVNGGSASASEIVAGAIKNQNRGIVVGQQTFGKGSVQVLYDFQDRSALKLTIAQYLTPGDISIQSVGIEPDVELIPASITDERIQVFVDDEHPREKDLNKHLDHSEGLEEEPAKFVRMVHLVEDEKEPDPEAEYNDDAFTVDFEIGLAREILVGSNSIKRKDLLKDSAELFASRSAVEAKRIADRFEKMGVPWKTSKKLQAPAESGVEATLEFVGASEKGFRSGDELTLKATAKNITSTQLEQVYGVTESDNPFFDKLEFAFGRLKAGETRSWETKIKLPPGLGSRSDLVNFKIGDQGGLGNNISASAFADVKSQAKPHFAYQYQLDDRSNGNGDGLLQVGEKVRMKIRVSNIGKGSGGEVMVTAKNMSGSSMFLKVGRATLGKLAAGESKVGYLDFRVSESPEDGPVKLRLGIWDSELGASVNEVIAMPVTKGVKGQKESRNVVVKGDKPVAVYAAASDSSMTVGTLPVGSVVRSEAVFGKGYRRVRFGDGYGFVSFANVKPRKGKVSKKPMKWNVGQAAPRITLSTMETRLSGSNLKFSAVVEDAEGLNDMYVYVNDKKVLYKALSEIPLVDGLYRIEVPMDLPVEDGSNIVTIVVRETKDLVSRRVFGVYRDGADTMAGRDASDKTRSHQ
ncbi:MAG: PDZ domain-containing protein [Deltaproteobacteria bacterium]|nr:PDZ domain-containing protein [Deltaproteobacteria bacterium]MBT6432105.1 PDZ domain-containing protein [Deltaproteobacteria bacterium]MBT6491814.1 PDZ domain-containing protein [Deltaproteobacteria bacterium]